MILSKLTLVENILTEISDNSTGQISPYDIRHNLLDTIDSAHLLLNGKPIQTSNFATPTTRTTKAGENTLEHIDLNGYSTIDNSAFGFSALKSNYQGSRNTAVGSQSLNCNIYGEDNVALGYTTLGGNSNGSGNIGIGNYALNGNTVGSFNIAIGHGAGYYVDRFTNHKLFIASHQVNNSDICDNPTGTGLIPLVHGDLLSNKFGINVTTLDSSGTLQVGGDISPSDNDSYDIGNATYQWKDIYATSIKLNNDVILSNDSLDLKVNASVRPTQSSSFDIGSISYPWLNGYFDNITVNGTATFNTAIAYQNCEYICKTIYLAASGCSQGLVAECDLLTDDQMLGGGLIAMTSGVGYQRNYKFIFSPPSSGVSCDTNKYAQASWFSNTSITLDSGVYLKSNRIVSYDSNCHGLFFDNSQTFFGRKNILDANPTSINGNLAGVGNINFFGNSGVVSDYISTIASLESGVSVSTRLLTGTKKRVKDTQNNNKDKLTGFEVKFIDTINQNLSTPSDRLVLGSYNNTSYMVNALCVMKDSNQGIVGINNFGLNADNVLPQTILNIRSTGNAIIRNVAENDKKTNSSLQLLGLNNCEYNGFEASYLNTSGVADLSMFKESGKTVFFRLYDNKTVGLFTSSGTSNAMFTIGDSFNNTATISMIAHSGLPTSTTSYGKLYIKPKIATLQSQSLYLMDDSGNIHDLILNKYDINDGRSLFTDNKQNTFGGLLCINDRLSTIFTSGNTAIGYKALNSLTSGNYNTIFGSSAGSGITTGSRNTVLGHSSANSITTGEKNIVIGENIFNNTVGSIQNNIIIGNSGLANGSTEDYQFYLGSQSNLVLLHGVLGPYSSSKRLNMPSGGKLYLYNSTNSDSLGLQANTIETLDYSGNDYPDRSLVFKFTGNDSADLLILNHSSNPLTNTPTYNIEGNSKPYIELKGDLRIQGSIRFSDNSSLDSSSRFDTLQDSIDSTNNNVSNISSLLQSLIVEGTTSHNISKPTNPSIPSSGHMILRNSNWQDVGSVTLVNRDTNLEIKAESYVVAIKINNEYRPLRVSPKIMPLNCCEG